MPAERALPAPDRRHHHFVAAAGTAVDFLAGAELQVLVEADPHFAEPAAAAHHRDRRTAETGIDLNEGLLEVGGSNGFRLRYLQNFLGDLSRGAGLPDGLE